MYPFRHTGNGFQRCEAEHRSWHRRDQLYPHVMFSILRSLRSKADHYTYAPLPKHRDRSVENAYLPNEAADGSSAAKVLPLRANDK